MGNDAKYTRHEAVSVPLLCKILDEEWQMTCDDQVVVTADSLAIDLMRLPREICSCLERKKNEITERMAALGLRADVRPARVILTAGKP